MSWNVENLFDVGDEDGPDTQAELKAKIESLRSVIDQLNPHVLGLQEIGSEAALGRLQAALETPMPYRAVAAPDERGIRVAFLSRRVLHDPLQIRPFPGGLLPVQVGDDPPGPDGPRTMNLMGRAALQVTVRANGRDVHLVNTHLKSKLLTFPGGFSPADEDQRARFAAYALYRRASEATTLRTHLDALLAGQGQTRPVILLGDMNDEPDAATTLILNGPPGSEIGSVGFDQPDQGDGARMWNTAPLIPEAKRFSRLYRGRMESTTSSSATSSSPAPAPSKSPPSPPPKGCPRSTTTRTPGSASPAPTMRPSSPPSTSNQHVRVAAPTV